LYYEQGENEKALEYYLKAQKINEEYNILNEHDREKIGLRVNVIKKKLGYYEDIEIKTSYEYQKGEDKKEGDF
jgi:tetratricopeptide (TPR) repeat protein